MCDWLSFAGRYLAWPTRVFHGAEHRYIDWPLSCACFLDLLAEEFGERLSFDCLLIPTRSEFGLARPSGHSIVAYVSPLVRIYNERWLSGEKLWARHGSSKNRTYRRETCSSARGNWSQWSMRVSRLASVPARLATSRTATSVTLEIIVCMQSGV
jgi:hypothetical protein